MRVSREQAEKNRQRVVDIASQLFREHGFDGIGLADIMKGAGLTHGGFYGQFDSKEDLVVEASRAALAKNRDKWAAVLAEHEGDALAALAAFYLAPDHRARRGRGCTLAALAADTARHPAPLKRAFEIGVRQHLDLLAPVVQGDTEEARRRDAMVALSTLVGALVLSRAVADDDFSREFLSAATRDVSARTASGDPPPERRDATVRP